MSSELGLTWPGGLEMESAVSDAAEISLHVDEESKRDLALLVKTISVLFITKGCTCLKKELSHFLPVSSINGPN